MRRLIPNALVAAVCLCLSSFVAQGQAPTPVVDPNLTPTPAPPPINVSIDGPSEVPSGGFALTITAPASGVQRWRGDLLPGGIELIDAKGRTVLAYFNPPAGVHKFTLSVQIPSDGLDPFAEDTHVVTVGSPTPPPIPPVVDPSDPAPPTPVEPPGPQPVSQVTAVCYVYEQRKGRVPPAVLAALDELNRGGKIVATIFDQDNIDGDDDVPEQYRPLREAGLAVGLPALVVSADSTIVRTVKAPKTKSEVLEAAR